MAPVYVPARGPEDWQRLLKDPVNHWRTGYSARTLACSWHDSDGWPPEIAQAFATAPESALQTTRPLLVIPEKITHVAGAGEPPHSDVFVLAKTGAGDLVSVTVEGKVDEPFGNGNQTVASWKREGSSPANRRIRLDQFLAKAGLDEARADGVAYQLIQRTASAVLEAETFNARFAVMIVHSFSPAHTNFAAFAIFTAAYRVTAQPGKLVEVAQPEGVRLFIGWVQGDPRFLAM